jgi:hypothetical protein
MSVWEEVILSIFLPTCMLALLYFYTRYLMLKALFIRQLDAMHVRLAQAQLLEGDAMDLEPIPWQTALDEASVRARSRIVRHHLAHPTYRNAVVAYEALEARVHIGMLLTVLASGVLIVLV